jgi:hypothetical protein
MMNRRRPFLLLAVLAMGFEPGAVQAQGARDPAHPVLTREGGTVAPNILYVAYMMEWCSIKRQLGVPP